jgi:hypothetical protein
MKKVIKYGFLYFLGIFIFAFGLGIIRNIFVIPYIGALYGVLLEIPILLTASWFYSLLIINRYSVSRDSKTLFYFGGFAFIILMIVEAIFSLAIFGRTWTEFLSELQTLHGALGLFAQIIFGIIPLFHKK